MCDKQRASGWPGVGPWGPHAPRRECVPFGASVHGGEDENYPYEDAHHIKQDACETIVHAKGTFFFGRYNGLLI